MNFNLKFHVRRMPRLKAFLKKLFRIEAVNHQFQELERKLVYGYIRQLEKRLDVLESKAGIKSLRMIDLGDQRPTTLKQVISQPATMQQMLQPEYAEWCKRLHDTPNFHRKNWEHIYILKALEQSGKLTPGMRGLGFGVGKDPTVAYMVKQGCDLIATDLAPAAAHAKGWAQTNQYSEQLVNLNERRICPDSAIYKHVQLRHVDMNEIPGDLRQGKFDFVWSACAYEHVGTIEKGLQFVINAMECLKPGGVAVHTTELNVSSNEDTIMSGDTVIFRKRDFEELAYRLRAKGYQIELNFNTGDLPLDRYYDIPPYSEFNHLKLQLQQHLTTSYGILVRKP